MKTKITLLGFAIATIFSSCSKETYFTNNSGSYGGYHKTEQNPTVQTTPAVEESLLTASAEAEPAAISQIPSFTAPKAAKAEVNPAGSAEALAAAPAAMSKKEMRAVVKEAKKELKKESKGLAADGKSQIVALILVALVGVLGIHRFYLGYIGIGIVQLLTFGGCGIWALIDLIRIITGDLGPKDGDYDKTL